MVTLDPLLAALRGIPQLSGAKCVGQWDIFDETDNSEIVEFACHLCAACPAINVCRAWFDSLPRTRRPEGVVAGRLRRNRKQAAA